MRLPRSVQEIADVIGRERALYLVGQLPTCEVIDSRTGGRGGRRAILYVPHARRLKPDHMLVRVLGWNDAERLCRHFGGEILQPASCAEIYRRFRDAELVRMVREGMSVPQAARVIGISDRQARNIAKEIPQEERRNAANDNAALGNISINGARI